MGGFSSEIKVGLMTVVTLSIMTWFLLMTRDAPFGLGQSYTIYSTLPSAEGIQFGSQVTMAGVNLGRVGKIELTPEGKARVSLELDKAVQLPTDSKLTVKSMGLLGDRSVHLLPGQASTMVGPGAELPYTSGEGDLDELTKKLGGVTDEVKTITADLKAISGSLKDTITSGSMQTSIENTLKNIEAISAMVNKAGNNSQDEIDDILNNIKVLTVSLNELIKVSQGVVKTSGDDVTDKLKSMDVIVADVNKTIASLHEIVSKVEKGEGTVGKLLNDSATIDTINQTLDTASDLVDKVNRFKATVDIRGDYYALGGDGVMGGMKNTLGVTLATRKDYYYLLEITSDPVMDFRLETTEVYDEAGNPISVRRERIYSDAYQYTFQFARRFRDLALRIGIKENHGAVGADYFLLKDRIALSADVYDFPTRTLPNLELRSRFGVMNHTYLSLGLDDVLNRAVGGGVNLYLGAGLSFQDDDLKYLLSFIPSP